MTGAAYVADFELTTTAKEERRADTRLIAQGLDVRHQSLFQLVKNYKSDFEAFGILRFQTGVINGRGQPERFALLNEDQAYLLLTFTRNTAKVRALKVKLIQAFRAARRAAEIRQFEYLPEYHRLHEAISAAAAGAPTERFMHINANKALNDLVNLKPGQRAGAGPLKQSLLAVGAALAARAVLARNGQGVHTSIKAALAPLEGALTLSAE